MHMARSTGRGFPRAAYNILGRLTKSSYAATHRPLVAVDCGQNAVFLSVFQLFTEFEVIIQQNAPCRFLKPLQTKLQIVFDLGLPHSVNAQHADLARNPP